MLCIQKKINRVLLACMRKALAHETMKFLQHKAVLVSPAVSFFFFFFNVPFLLSKLTLTSNFICFLRMENWLTKSQQNK